MAETQFEIEEQILTFEDEKNGFRKELNLVSWKGRKAKYDIRGWNQDHTQMTKGIVLNKEEMKQISLAALQHMEEVQKCF